MTTLNNHFIIGLGGTGGKVIREFRKLFERENQINDDTKYEFLYVDTNAEFMQHGDPNWKVLGKSVQLDQAQQLLIESANLGAVINNPAGYPQIEPWLQPVAPIKNLININTVAGGQRRKFGRFLFANRAREFMSKANDRIKLLQANRGSAVKIHVVCGLAGGTGSGSVVDVVAQLRKQYPDANQIKIVVYAVLPEAIPKANWDSGNYHANGYAALSELNALAVGNYLPIDLTGESGRRVERASIQFNGCYVLTNENAGGYSVDTDKELPGIIAEYIFVKTQITNWEALDKAENSENGTFDDEPSVFDNNVKERSPRFLSFGIRRMVVPNEEIEEYLTYNFAQRAVNQSVFNNWVDGLGYADEARPADHGAEVRKPEFLQKWLLTDEHLMLSVGVLPDDASNTRWKKINEFWVAAVGAQVKDIQNTSSEKTKWFSELKVRCEKNFDEGYRGLGGVKKFYEIKLKARSDMARCIRNAIELDIFSDWRTGQRSTAEVDRLLSALVSSLEERLTQLDSRVESNSKASASHLQKVSDIDRRIGGIGIFDKILLNKLPDLFNEGAAHLQDSLICRTNEEGLKFARKLLEEALQQIVDLKASVGQFQSKLLEAGKSFSDEVEARLKQEKVDYKQKIFNVDDIRGLNKTLLVAEDTQKEQAQAVRGALIKQTGEHKQSFSAINERLSLSDLKEVFESVCSQEVARAHENVVVSQKRILNVNIVQKIREDYSSNSEKLGQFVRDAVNKAGVFVKFNQTQIGLSGPGTVSDRVGNVVKTSGVFLPYCKEANEFRDQLAQQFEANKVGAAFAVLGDGARSNELTVLGISNLFTLRCIEPLAALKAKYESRKDASEEARSLMHSEGDGSQFPPLLVPALSDVKATKLPLVLLAKAMGMLKERPDRNTGKPMTIFTYEDDGLPMDESLGKGTFLDAVEDMSEKALTLIERDLLPKIKKAVHAQRLEWLENVKSVVREIYVERGQNASDEIYQKYANMMRIDVKKLLELL
ncbi:MAG: hypothetical protein BWK72_19770 [Rhodoferax ferrireducens]|uniref:Tubulin like n=1 Tax=Rhodoferax ferrireducens TaxID=192843 RepID=A0A1W9KP31_9BURK|nr:MAG: hypothetical protein BWK72_19770 [Rhodoferax ferrireducens]